MPEVLRIVGSMCDRLVTDANEGLKSRHESVSYILRLVLSTANELEEITDTGFVNEIFLYGSPKSGLLQRFNDSPGHIS